MFKKWINFKYMLIICIYVMDKNLLVMWLFFSCYVGEFVKIY